MGIMQKAGQSPGRLERHGTGSPQAVLVSLGEHHAFNDGLGEFSRQLCSRFAAAAPALRETHGIELCIHLKEHLVGSFGDQVRYVVAHRDQRRAHRQPTAFALWHSLHQLNRTLAPAGTPAQWVTVHDLNYLHGKNWFSRWRDSRRMRALLTRTDEIITNTRFVENDVRQNLAWKRPLQTIDIGVTDLSQTPREALPLPASRYLLHVSRMTVSKNVQTLIELAAAWPEQHLVLVGPAGPHPKALAEQARARGLANVTVLTSVSEAQKAWLYANCEGLLFPSLAEGFGLPVIEAMYFGKPVFLSRLTSLPEVGGTLANYFDDFSPQAMRRTVQAGLARYAEPGMPEAIRQWASRYNWDDCAQRYLARYVAFFEGSDRTRS
jgi:glycosyltransferase involved in cell wall biosynthesis